MSLPVILILNGPNLNMLGRREPEIYGTQTLNDIKIMCRDAASNKGFAVDFRQSNSEGEIVTWLQESLGKINAIIINAAAYTHTSVAIHDALKLFPKTVPIIEVHLSNPKERESFRHFSYIESVATARYMGQGANGYVMAIDHIVEVLGVN